VEAVIGILLVVLPLIPDWRTAILVWAALAIAIRWAHASICRRGE
jgi:hypothetical protein